MEASVLLQIIKDDIKILNNLAIDLASANDLTPDEVEIVLTRARNVVKELELLESKVKNNVGELSKTPSHKEMTEPVEKIMTEANQEKESKKEGFAIEKEVQKVNEKEQGNDSKKTEEALHDSEIELLEDNQTERAKTLGESVTAQRSLNDLIGDEHHEDAYTNRPLKSIREGISLNDRYLFVRELFGNNNEKFNETVDALDNAGNIQAAVDYMKTHHKWSKSEASQKFLSLVKRRFLN